MSHNERCIARSYNEQVTAIYESRTKKIIRMAPTATAVAVIATFFDYRLFYRLEGYGRYKNIPRKLLMRGFQFFPLKIHHPPLKYPKSRDSDGNFSSVIHFTTLQAKN